MPDRNIHQIIAGQRLLRMPPEASVGAAVAEMSARDVASILVTEETTLVGIFTERDLLQRVVARGLDPEETRLAEVMTEEPVTVAPEATSLDAMRTMAEHRVRHLPVVREGSEAFGVVSMRDFLAAEIREFRRELEARETLWEQL